MTDVKNYRLMSMPHAQCRVEIRTTYADTAPQDTAPHRTAPQDTAPQDSIKFGTRVTLFSYDTAVLTIVHDSISAPRILKVYGSGIYSRTTSRHINSFTTEFFGSNLYHLVKRALSKNRSLERMRLFDTYMLHLWDVASPSELILFHNRVQSYHNNAKRYTGRY